MLIWDLTGFSSLPAWNLSSSWRNKNTESLGRALQYWLCWRRTQRHPVIWGMCWSTGWQESQHWSWDTYVLGRLLGARSLTKELLVHMEHCCWVSLSPGCQNSCSAELQQSQPGWAVQGIAQMEKGCAALVMSEPSAEKEEHMAWRLTGLEQRRGDGNNVL